MSVTAALFLFLAAAVVAVFAFCSIVVWVSMANCKTGLNAVVWEVLLHLFNFGIIPR